MDQNVDNNENVTANDKSIKKKKILTISALLALLVVVVLCIVIPYAVVMGDSLYVDHVDEIKLGATAEEVVDVLGEPDDKSDDGAVWKWVKKNKHCYVTFTDGKVSELELNASENAKSRKIAGIVIDEPNYISWNAEAAEIVYKVKYMDGSLVKGKDTIALRNVNEVSTNKTSRSKYKQMAKWESALGEIDYAIKTFEYEKQDETIRLFNYSGFVKWLELPLSIDGVAVTGLADGTFNGLKNLEKVYIDSQITSVEKRSFIDCLNVVIECEAQSKPDGWDDSWDASNGKGVEWNKEFIW